MAKGHNFGALGARILVAALPRIACVIKPFPADADPDDLNATIRSLRAQGLVHGTPKSPNLTPSGIEAARQLAARLKPAKA